MNVTEFLKRLKKQAIRNDSKISSKEQRVIDAILGLDDEASNTDIYFEVVKALYSDHKLAEDESDIASFTRDVLKISPLQHRNALLKLGKI